MRTPEEIKRTWKYIYNDCEDVERCKDTCPYDNVCRGDGTYVPKELISDTLEYVEQLENWLAGFGKIERKGNMESNQQKKEIRLDDLLIGIIPGEEYIEVFIDGLEINGRADSLSVLLSDAALKACVEVIQRSNGDKSMSIFCTNAKSC